MPIPLTRIDYCQFLLSSQINYTQTYFADHSEQWSHDTVNRYLKKEKLTPKLVWEHTQAQIVLSSEGYLVFDDTVPDKNFSSAIDLVRYQYSGNSHSVIKGIGVVGCVYVNPETNQFWVIDFRIYAPDEDGKSKLQHVQDMLRNSVYAKQVPFHSILMDTWYAAKWLMRYIEKLGKVYYCPMKANRQVDLSYLKGDYQRIDSLVWFTRCREQGKIMHIKGFPKGHHVKGFRLLSSTGRTDYIVTNDLSQDSTTFVQEASDCRWKIEQFHRETKQITGIEKCQCRKQRSQRNHIICAILVWNRFKQIAYDTKETVYQLKQKLLDEYMKQELISPRIKMEFA